MKSRLFGYLAGCFLLLFAVAPVVADVFDPPANSEIHLSPPSPGVAKSTMKATVHADGMRYGFYFSFGVGAVDKGGTAEVGDYVYKKAITWSRSPNDGVGSWEPHQGAGYIDAYLWQTILNAQTPNYTVSVKGQRKKKGSSTTANGPGQDVWEDWETDAKQFAVEFTAPEKDAVERLGDTVQLSAKATFDAAAISLTHLRIKIDGAQVLDSATTPATYQWDTTHATSGPHTIEVSGEGTLQADHSTVSDSVTQTVTLVKVDLSAAGITEEQEESPGAPVMLNDDNDNNNVYSDPAPTGHRPYEPIWDKDELTASPQENDLLAITIHPIEPNNLDGTATLKITAGADNIRFWTLPSKGTAPVLLPNDINELPPVIYAEGLQNGSTTLNFVL
jgi:hypothetical protein